MFIQTEATPNPQTIKFIPGRTVLPERSLDIRSSEEAVSSPLAQRLFAIDGVKGVFLGYDFISVTKDDRDWSHVKAPILAAIMDHFMGNHPILSEGLHIKTDEEGEFFEPEDANTVETIKELLETRIRPAVAGDGGDITFRGFKEGIVYLTMKGACAGCPSSTATLRHGIQNLLKHYLPDVKEVQAL